MSKLHEWSDLARESWDFCLIGNGASCAVHRKFGYPSLKELASKEDFTQEVEQVFEQLGTSDFEYVLRVLWHASLVTQALGVEQSDASVAYQGVRKSFIRAVCSAHPVHGDVKDALKRGAQWLRKFPTVFSFNYDLLVYWSMMLGGSTKDGFRSGEFQHDSWRKDREGSTLVLYPHGHLALATHADGTETKIKADGSALLERITTIWEEGKCVPLFVAEGKSDQKLTAIKRSAYLRTVYFEALQETAETAVVYGLAFSEQDAHLLKALKVAGVKRLAVSQFTPDKANPAADRDLQAGRIRDVLGDGADVLFYDAESPGCWIHPVRGET